jgi:hypothetical protein
MNMKLLGNTILRKSGPESCYCAVRTFYVYGQYLTHITPCDANGIVTCGPEEAYEKQYASEAEARAGHVATETSLCEAGCLIASRS